MSPVHKLVLTRAEFASLFESALDARDATFSEMAKEGAENPPTNAEMAAHVADALFEMAGEIKPDGGKG